MFPSVADSDPGSGAFLILGSGIQDGKNPDLGSGIRNKHPESYHFRELSISFVGLKILKFFVADPGFGSL
jgi:hypothetical protein